VNNVAVEDAQEALDTIVLFDSGASHSFVAANFVQKHNLPLSMLKNRMIISSAGGICMQGMFALRLTFL
jgi:hypothetical protein